MIDSGIVKDLLKKSIDEFDKYGVYVDDNRIDKLTLDLINQYESEVRELQAFKSYFDELYGKGLDIANWHLNGVLEPFDNFYESALQEMAGGNND